MNASNRTEQEENRATEREPSSNTVHPGGGLMVAETVTQGSYPMNDAAPENIRGPAPARHCTGPQKNGKPCGARNVLLTSEGWRCRHHRLGLELPQAPQLKPPVAVIRTKADADRFTNWVLQQGTRNMKAATVTALLRGVDSWRKTQERAEQGIVDEWRTLIAAVKKLQRTYDEAIADLPDHHAERVTAIEERVTAQLAEMNADVQAAFARLETLHANQDKATG